MSAGKNNVCGVSYTESKIHTGQAEKYTWPQSQSTWFRIGQLAEHFMDPRFDIRLDQTYLSVCPVWITDIDSEQQVCIKISPVNLRHWRFGCLDSDRAQSSSEQSLS